MSSTVHAASHDAFLATWRAPQARRGRQLSIDAGVWRAIATGIILAVIGLGLTALAIEAGNTAAYRHAAIQTEATGGLSGQMPVP